jgi:hypothetical protein
MSDFWWPTEEVLALPNHPRALPPETLQIRSLMLYVDLVGTRPIWLLTLGAWPVQTDPDGFRRIVWMIKRIRLCVGWQGKLCR